MIEECEINGTYWFHGDHGKNNGWSLDEIMQINHMTRRILKEKGMI